jgi:hypothetical protein
MAMNSFKCSAGLAVIAGLVVAGCGGSGVGSTGNGGTVSFTGGFVYKTGIAQEDIAASPAARTANVSVDGVVIETLLPKGTAISKGEEVDVLLQNKPVISGLKPSDTAAVSLEADDEDGVITTTGLVLRPDGIFDLPEAKSARRVTFPPITKKRRRDLTQWQKRTYSIVGAVTLTDGTNELAVKNGIQITSWAQRFVPAHTTTSYITSGQPTWAGNIPANGGSATGAHVVFSLPQRAYDSANIYDGWPVTLTIKVSQDYSYDQKQWVANSAVTFDNLTHQDHDDIPKKGINHIDLAIDRVIP